MTARPIHSRRVARRGWAVSVVCPSLRAIAASWWCSDRLTSLLQRERRALRSGSPAAMALDRLADPAARAVEQDPLVPGGDLQRRAHLIRAPALDVAQRDHGPLRSRQLGDR